MINHIRAILWKQLKDTVKNKTILIQFIMFPCMTVIMEKAVHIQGMTEHFFANLFAVMYIGMAPLTSIAALISEEKEKNTLRVLQMCNVKAFEYLLGNAIYIVSVCMIGSLVIGLAGDYTRIELLYFMIISFLGHNISVLLGAMIGLNSRNQMAATSVSVPVMMIFSFLPMLSMFNQTIRNIAKYIYSEQLFVLINSLDRIHINVENIMILLCNIVIITALFLVTYRRIL